jgi:hypothetical protein
MRLHKALILVGAAWFANQAVGYCVLSYPRTWDSFGWGAAIGIAAVTATIAAASVASLLRVRAAAAIFGFAAAFVTYEGALLAATLVLPSSAAAFSAPVVARILGINVCAFLGLLALQQLAVRVGLLERAGSLRLAFGN